MAFASKVPEGDNRLTAADYSTGDYYHYTYDSAGNRLSQQSLVSGQSSVVTYQYDSANRLTNINWGSINEEASKIKKRITLTAQCVTAHCLHRAAGRLAPAGSRPERGTDEHCSLNTAHWNWSLDTGH